MIIGLLAVSAVSAADNNSISHIQGNDVKEINVDANANLENLNDASSLESDDVSSDSQSADDVSSDSQSLEDISSDVDDDTIVSKEKSKLSSSSAYNCYVDSVSTYYMSGKNVYLGWYGYFEGYFKVYRGPSCIHSEYISGYNQDLVWSTDNLNAGTFSAKLVSTYGYTVASGTIKIAKATAKVSCKSFATTAGTKFSCYAYVYDKNDGANINGGYVYYKINGKTYKASLKNGVAILKFTVPSKAKTYSCKAYILAGSNIAAASTNFKMTVKKKAKVKYKTISVSTKLNRYVSKKWSSYKAQTYKFKNGGLSTLCMFLYKNGNMKNPYTYLTRYHYKYKGKWHWTSWRTSYGEAAYHKTAGIRKGVTIGSVQFKFRI